MKIAAIAGGLAAVLTLVLVNPTAAGAASGPARTGAATIQTIGCSESACLNAWASGSGTNVQGEYAPGRNDANDIYGHFRFWGPHYAFNEADHPIQGWYPGDTHWVNSQGVHCMELWERLGDGSYRSRGLPCVSA